MTGNTITIDRQQVDSLIKRVEYALKHDLSITADDTSLLLQMLHTLLTFNDQLQDKDVTISKLRKLAGLVSKSEAGARDENGHRKRQGKRRRKNKNGFAPNADKPPKNIHHTQLHPVEGLSKGALCPHCQAGKLYKVDPATFVRISGEAPLTATRHILEQLRCNACGEYFKAELSETIRNDGAHGQQYGYSARAMMAIGKQLGGTPFFRQQSMQDLFGYHISASTVFDQCQRLAESLQPLFFYFITLAGGARQIAVDDTGNRILSETGRVINDRRSDKPRFRTGIYTSALMAWTDSNYPLVLFKTNIGHAGEWLDEVLKHRAVELPAPLIMSDALSRNQPSVIDEWHWCLCNSHARREFDACGDIPEVGWIIDEYEQIWQNENICVEKGMDATQRLQWHQSHSLPVMQGMLTQCQRWLDSDKVEANSALGKACQYFINHYDGLCGFCRYEYAMLDNNVVERIIKLIIRGRKNSLFFKSQNGADVADILISVMATVIERGENVFEYLVAVQQNEFDVGRNPQQWMPWNFRENLQTQHCPDESSKALATPA